MRLETLYQYRKIHIDYRWKLSYRIISTVSLIHGNTTILLYPLGPKSSPVCLCDLVLTVCQNLHNQNKTSVICAIALPECKKTSVFYILSTGAEVYCPSWIMFNGRRPILTSFKNTLLCKEAEINFLRLCARPGRNTGYRVFASNFGMR